MGRSGVSTDASQSRKRAVAQEKVSPIPAVTPMEAPVIEIVRQRKKVKTNTSLNIDVVDPPDIPIVISKPVIDSCKRTKWKVTLDNPNEGILVPRPKKVTRKTGVIVTDYIVGKGNVPKPGAKVKITYHALYPNGTVFDEHVTKKKPFVFRLGTAQVIRGLDLGLDGMRIGGAREIVIPSALGYGDEGHGDIPGDQVLIFRVYLLGVEMSI